MSAPGSTIIAEHAPASVEPTVPCAKAAGFFVRDATPEDNRDLIELAAACPMEGDIALRMDRGPDFFALNRLEGERWRVAVADVAGRAVGCIATSERRVFVNGEPMRIGYVGDFKVHPRHRTTAIADELSHYAERILADLPPSSPLMITVLAGNRSMERRLSGPRGVPAFRRIATIRTHSIPILWERGLDPRNATRVETARWTDLESMVQLWNHVAPQRQLAPALTANDFADFVCAAPGLEITSYRIARSPQGEVVGFLGVWDQRSFKQLTVIGYSHRMRFARLAFNAAARLAGAEPLPRAGEPLSSATIAHLCVPSKRPDVLRALLTSAYNELRTSGCSILNVGLDVRDPLTSALRGLHAQPTDVNAYIVTSRRGVLPVALDDRPLHYEIALV